MSKNPKNYQIGEWNGAEYYMVPVSEARELGMFQVSEMPGYPIVTSDSKLPGPEDWNKIGWVDIAGVTPHVPSTQDGFPEVWAIVAPGDIDWSVTLRPAGHVNFIGLSVSSVYVEATLDVETGEWLLDDVKCAEGIVSTTTVKALNTDTVTGGEDKGTDMNLITRGGPDFMTIHGISQEVPLTIRGKVLPTSAYWQLVRVSPAVLAQPSKGTELRAIALRADNRITRDMFEASVSQAISDAMPDITKKTG